MPHEELADGGARLDWGRGPFPASERRRALLRELLAAPAERALYERYARLAIEEGDPRGEHVRLSLLAADRPEEGRAELLRALETLRARYGKSLYAEWLGSRYGAWLGPLVRAAADHERFGFVSHLEGPPAELAALRALTPLLTFSPRIRPGQRWRAVLPADAAQREGLGEVLDLEGVHETWPGVRALAISNHSLSDLALESLAQLPQLERLTLSYRCPRELLSTLARPGAFPALRSLALWDCPVDLPRLAEVARQRSLEELSVLVSGSRALEGLLGALDGAPLRTLALYGHGPDLYAPLDLRPFASARLPSLRRLELGEYLLEHPEALGEAPALATLRELALSGVENGGQALAALAGPIAASSLRRLEVLSCLGVAEAEEPLLLSGALRRLTALRLSPTPTSPARLLGGLEELGGLEDLELGAVDEASLELLPRLPRLRSFRCSYYRVDPAAALRAWAAGGAAPSLRTLDLPDPAGAEEGAVRALIESPALRDLGSVGLLRAPGDPEPATLTLLRRRFGHRLIAALRASPGHVAYGPLPEPDLDPWG